MKHETYNMKQKDIKREINLHYSLSDPAPFAKGAGESKGLYQPSTRRLRRLAQAITIQLILISFLILVGVPIVLADVGGGTGGWEVPNPLKAKTFEQLVVSIADWIRKLAIPVVVIFIIYSGVLFMTSGGNEEKINQAKKTFFWAIIGTAIILIGSGFVYLIKDILQVK